MRKVFLISLTLVVIFFLPNLINAQQLVYRTDFEGVTKKDTHHLNISLDHWFEWMWWDSPTTNYALCNNGWTTLYNPTGVIWQKYVRT